MDDEVKYSDPNPTNNYEYYNPNPIYQNPQSEMNQQSDLDQTPMSMGDWLLTILAMMIPCVGIILYLIWAFGKKGNVNRRNYCRAYLVIYAVIMVIYIIIALVFGIFAVGSF